MLLAKPDGRLFSQTYNTGYTDITETIKTIYPNLW